MTEARGTFDMHAATGPVLPSSENSALDFLLGVETRDDHSALAYILESTPEVQVVVTDRQHGSRGNG